MNLRKRQAQIQELVAVGPATQEIAERLASGRKPLALTGRGRRPCVPCPLANFRLRSLRHRGFRQLTLPQWWVCRSGRWKPTGISPRNSASRAHCNLQHCCTPSPPTNCTPASLNLRSRSCNCEPSCRDTVLWTDGRVHTVRKQHVGL